MKVALFTDTFIPDVNGVAKTLAKLTNYFEHQKIDYQVFAPESINEDLFSKQIHRFISLPFFLYPECRLALPNMLKIKTQLQEFQPDIIHIATPFNIGLCGLHYAKKMNIPIVGSYHTDFEQYLSYYDLNFLSPFLWKYMKWFHQPLERIFVPSQATKDHLQSKGFTNLSIWSRGVDHTLFHPHYDRFDVRIKYNIKKPYILTYVGRLAPEKNLNTFMEIAKSMPPHIRHKIHWLIVGDGPLKEQLQKESLEHMTFTGFLQGEHLAKVYAASDLFVFPSATETFGNVVLESLACGTPVVGANAGGVKTIVQQGRNGYLCNPNSVQEFVHHIVELLEDLHKRIHFGHQGRNYALTQTWDSIFERLLMEYEEALINRKQSIQLA
ncbi:glycosyltransferase family 4 protein [Metabacillus iocasae]|uniref:Glycosyltransferase involved in cell wall biosynthesis n=1 Tax=Priestia iocasae TaxID=2291674 RepID=A0ABS2R033_9BACI|nr:glycosyltransferase family 1 protein [Metabacillus iocasae]MBM7704843.1 glycosyltransferase involved in cell wall biosynthesis [Metabacillus iocasae]